MVPCFGSRSRRSHRKRVEYSRPVFSSVVMGMPKINRTGRKVVVLDLATGQIADDGVSPVGQLNSKPFDFAAIELGFALNGRRQAQPLAGSMDSSDILDLGLYLNKMGQDGSPLLCVVEVNGGYFARFSG